jgi:hypothetical protein
MQVIVAIVCLGLLMWLEPASAQQTKTHFLTVGHHEKAKITDDEVDKILAEASKVLAKCKVILKREGPVRKFASSRTPSFIDTPSSTDPRSVRDAVHARDAVHSENFDVKVIELPIGFCRFGQLNGMGCAWDPPPPPEKERPKHKSIIVGRFNDTKFAGKIWAHEFGHTRGLPHRSDKTALMACKVERAQISEDEC